MKKISTAAAQQTRNFENQKLTIGLDLGDSHELVSRSGRSGGSAAGTKAEHDSEDDARGVRRDAAESAGSGNGDAFEVREPGF